MTGSVWEVLSSGGSCLGAFKVTSNASITVTWSHRRRLTAPVRHWRPGSQAEAANAHSAMWGGVARKV